MPDFAFILAGFAVGLIVGLTGVGGGSLMTPVLIFVFGVKPNLAVGTDLLFAAFTKLGGTLGLARQRLGRIDLQTPPSLPIAARQARREEGAGRHQQPKSNDAWQAAMGNPSGQGPGQPPASLLAAGVSRYTARLAPSRRLPRTLATGVFECRFALCQSVKADWHFFYWGTIPAMECGARMSRRMAQKKGYGLRHTPTLENNATESLVRTCGRCPR